MPFSTRQALTLTQSCPFCDSSRPSGTPTCLLLTHIDGLNADCHMYSGSVKLAPPVTCPAARHWWCGSEQSRCSHDLTITITDRLRSGPSSSMEDAQPLGGAAYSSCSCPLCPPPILFTLDNALSLLERQISDHITNLRWTYEKWQDDHPRWILRNGFSNCAVSSTASRGWWKDFFFLAWALKSQIMWPIAGQGRDPE